MTTSPSLFPSIEELSEADRTTGVLPAHVIETLISASRIVADLPISPEQIQPASLDLRLGSQGYRVQASFLPGKRFTVEERVDKLRMTDVDLSRPAILETGCIYIVPLQEYVSLPSDISGYANPKSTTGRLDIFTRLVTDYSEEFERIPAGYKGKLYVEIVPRTFSVLVQQGMKLNQLRLVRGNPAAYDGWITRLDQQEPLVFSGENNPVRANVDRGLRISLSLRSSDKSGVVAYRAKKHAPVIDLSKINYYEPEMYWETVPEPKDGQIVLNPGDFYILASSERVRVPPDYAAEMVAFDPAMGEFRIHYAGFFDPGFGDTEGRMRGTRAVLEVRAHEVPFVMEHGQVVGRLTYFKLLSRSSKIYGGAIGSSYQGQELALSKQFKKA